MRCAPCSSSAIITGRRHTDRHERWWFCDKGDRRLDTPPGAFVGGRSGTSGRGGCGTILGFHVGPDKTSECASRSCRWLAGARSPKLAPAARDVEAEVVASKVATKTRGQSHL
jgi:hypothetical protein